MPKKTFRPTQAAINETVSDAISLAHELGFPQEEADRQNNRKLVLLTNISMFSLMVLSINPFIEGWKR